jgi:hypothetical protein
MAGLPDQLEGALGNGEQSGRGLRGRCRCRVSEHPDHHEGLAFAVRGQVAQGQDPGFGAALEPDGGPLRRIKLDVAVVGRQDGTERFQRGLGRELPQSGEGPADVIRSWACTADRPARPISMSAAVLPLIEIIMAAVCCTEIRVSSGSSCRDPLPGLFTASVKVSSRTTRGTAP